jgi:hypothetical protein
MSFDRGIRGVKIDVAFGFANRFDDLFFESAEFLDGFMTEHDGIEHLLFGTWRRRLRPS